MNTTTFRSTLTHRDYAPIDISVEFQAAPDFVDILLVRDIATGSEITHSLTAAQHDRLMDEARTHQGELADIWREERGEMMVGERFDGLS